MKNAFRVKVNLNPEDFGSEAHQVNYNVKLELRLRVFSAYDKLGWSKFSRRMAGSNVANSVRA